MTNPYDNDKRLLELLERWQSGDFTSADEQEIQSLTGSDEFRRESAEGFMAMPDVDHAKHLTSLQKRLKERTGTAKRVLMPQLLTAVAAVVLLVVAVVWLIPSTENAAKQESLATESAPPVPPFSADSSDGPSAAEPDLAAAPAREREAIVAKDIEGTILSQTAEPGRTYPTFAISDTQVSFPVTAAPEPAAGEVAVAEMEQKNAEMAKVEEALANEEAAEHKLSYTHIRAPFNGFINRIPFKIGSLINEGSLLTSISENNQVFAYFDVSEKEYLAYAENSLKDSTGSKKVDLILADGKMHEQKGRIETIEGEIDGSTGNIAFRARFPNPDKILKHGASGKVRMTKRLINVLAIPQKATFEIQDKLYVYVVNKDNKLDIRNVTASNRLSHLFIISKSLKDKDMIVYEGIQNVSDGTVIHPRFIAMKEIFKELASE